MRIAVIDNIDSFVYNLVQYVGELGAEPIIFQNDTALRKIEASNPDGIIISPGPKTPMEAGVSNKVVKILGREIPVLGVCLGHQVIAYSFGGKIGKAERLMHGKKSKIECEDNYLFRDVPNPFEATRYHSLIVESSLPDCLEIIARTDDEFREIMGIRHRDYPISGIQFHPESILTTYGKKIIENFLMGVEN